MWYTLTSRIVSKLVDVEAMIPRLQAVHLTSDSCRPVSLQNSKVTYMYGCDLATVGGRHTVCSKRIVPFTFPSRTQTAIFLSAISASAGCNSDSLCEQWAKSHEITNRSEFYQNRARCAQKTYATSFVHTQHAYIPSKNQPLQHQLTTRGKIH